MRIIAGTDKEFNGEVVFSKGYSVGYLEQEPKLDESKTVRQIVEEAVQATVDLLKEFEEINAEICRADGRRRDERAYRTAGRSAGKARRTPTRGIWIRGWKWRWTRCAARRRKRRLKTFRGGEKRRVALCRLLLQKPDILLLDEPTNHLDAETVAWLEQHLQKYEGTIIAVTHDRYFLDNVAGWILELDRGEGIPWKGNYSSWLEQKQNRLAQEQKDRRQAAENSGARAGMDSDVAERSAREIESAHQRLRSRWSRRQSEKRAEDLEIFIPPGERLGDIVIEAHGVSKGLRR